MRTFINKALSAFSAASKIEENDISDLKHTATTSQMPKNFQETKEEAWAREFNNGVTADELGEIGIKRVNPGRSGPSGMG